MALLDVVPGRRDLGARGVLPLRVRQPRVLIGSTALLGLGGLPLAFRLGRLALPFRVRRLLLAPALGVRGQPVPLGLDGLALTFRFGRLPLPLLFLFDRPLGASADVQRLRLVGVDAQRRVAADDRGAELTGVELADRFADQRRRLRAAPRRRLGLLARQVDLGAQALEDTGVGAVAGRLIGVALRFLEGAVDDGPAGLLHRVADPILPRPLAGRLLVDRGLGTVPNLPRLVEARLVELGFRRRADRAGPVAALERRSRPLDDRGERHLVAGPRHRLAQQADAGVAGPDLDGLRHQGIRRLEVAARDRRLRVRQVFVGLALVERGLGPAAQFVRPRFVLVDGAGAVAVLDGLLELAGVEGLDRRLHVLGDLLLADAVEDAVLARPRRRPRRARRMRAAGGIIRLEPRVLVGGRPLFPLQAPAHARQVAVHRRQVGIAAVGVLLQRPVNDLLDLGVGVADHLPQPR